VSRIETLALSARNQNRQNQFSPVFRASDDTGAVIDAALQNGETIELKIL